jgi:hypothetical protein
VDEPGGLSIALRRSGGILPGQVLEAFVHEADLDDEEAEGLRQLVAGADPAALAARSPITGRGADMYQYDIVINQEGRRHHVKIHSGQVPERVRPLIALLEARA